MKIGLIAGGGKLPHHVVSGAQAKGYEVFVSVMDGFADSKDFQVKAETFGLAEFGRNVRALKREKCTHICFAGNISRPDFTKLKPDMKGVRYLPGAIKAAASGDDRLMAYVLSIYEGEGFEILSPQALCENLLLPEGDLGAVKYTETHRLDAEKARDTALAIGALDIGQGAIACRGVILAVEAQEGTDAMLIRAASLPPDIRGSAEKREGVLAKMVKPGQEDRIDMPSIGVTTVELAAAAGLAGIVAEASRAFIFDRDEVIKTANERGLFVTGLPVNTRD